MKKKPTPHDYRRDAVTFWISLPCILLIISFIVMACSCTTTKYRGKDPCKERRGMSGYGYGWIECKETSKSICYCNTKK